jgi:hypothetical protein
MMELLVIAFLILWVTGFLGHALNVIFTLLGMLGPILIFLFLLGVVATRS